MKRIICVLVSIFLVCSCLNISAFASSIITDADIWIPENCALSNQIIVVLDKETSLELNEYSISDFTNIECKGVADLSVDVKNDVKCRVQNIVDNAMNGKSLDSYDGVEPDKFNQILCVEIENSSERSVASALQKIRNMPGVKYACPNYCLIEEIYEGETVASSRAANLSTDYLDIIEASDAWDITVGSSNVSVGLLSSGIYSYHLELSDKLDNGLHKNFTDNIGADDDPNPLNDVIGTGTFAAGIILKCNINSTESCGLCENIELVSLKVTERYRDANDNRQSRTYLSWVIEAINYASVKNIDILNIIPFDSIDDVADDDVAGVFTEAIENYNGIVICGAGDNNSGGVDITSGNNAVYPASLSLSNILAVGASTTGYTGGTEMKSSTSNYSSTAVDVYAPGDYIHTTDLYNSFTYVAGTRFSSSMVAGVAALMLSANSSLTPSEIRYMISYGGDYVSSLSGKSVYGTRLNAYTALQYANGHNCTITNLSGGGHRISCSHCGYSEIVEHDYRVSGDNTVSCTTCGYAPNCDADPECGYKNIYTHYVDCPDGCYHFIAPHAWRSYDTTRCICNDCGALVLKTVKEEAYFEN